MNHVLMEAGTWLFCVSVCVCVTKIIMCHLVCMYKTMFRPEVIRRDELCFFQSCAKLPSLPRASEIHHVVIPVERSTSVYINLVRCVYHCYTFSLVLGVSPIAIVVVVCLINILICSSGVLR